MSRPLKTGLDYFPMDVDMDDKVELIEAKHGITGFGILIKLYQRIYKEGYFLRWTEETQLLFSKRINVDINKVIEVINDCLRYQLFDETLYKKYNIFTSPGIQKRYLQAIDRRKEIELIKNYIIVDINGLNVVINWINVDNNTQSKEKKSKEKNIYNHSIDGGWSVAESQFTNINKVYPKLFLFTNPLKFTEHQTLIKKYGKENVEIIYNEMQNYKDLLKKSESAYLTATNWLNRKKK